MSGSGRGIVTPYNTHRGIDYDGAVGGARHFRAADLAGNADGSLGILSIWFRIDGGDGTVRYMLYSAGPRLLIGLSAANRLWIRAQTAVPATILEWLTTPTYLAGSGWHHLLCSYNLTTPVGTIWVDGAQPALTTNTVNLGVIDYTVATWGYGGRAGAAVSEWNGALSEGYFNFAEAIDLTVQANRELIRHPNGQPPNIVANGSGPTGNQPIMYMVEVGGALVNLGSGGAFVVGAGVPALSADTPKDRWVASLNRGSRKRRVYAAGG